MLSKNAAQLGWHFFILTRYLNVNLSNETVVKNLFSYHEPFERKNSGFPGNIFWRHRSLYVSVFIWRCKPALWL